MPHDLHGLLRALGITLLVAFILYRRIRRVIGRQRVRTTRLWIRVGIFTILGGVILFFGAGSLNNWIGAGLGGVLGVAIAYYALRHTAFESTPDGFFYVPNLYIGLGLSALLIGRLAYRFLGATLLQSAAAPDQPPPRNPFAHTFDNPFTIGLFFVTAGYYVCYYVGILRHFQKLDAPTHPDVS